MKKILSVLVVIALLTVGSVAYANPEFTLNLGHGAAPSNPRHLVAVDFANYVLEATNGRIKIEVFPSETLGSDRQMAEAVAMGALDMSINSQGPVSNFNEKLNVVGLPFLFETPEQAFAVLDGEIGEEISEGLSKRGLRVLAYWDNGFRHVSNNVRAINTPADLKGLKIRTPEDRVTLAIFNALGASPAPLAFGELYMALSQGLFDGQENPITNIYYSKLHEVQKFISLTNHKYETNPLIISERTWSRIPADLQGILRDAARKFATEHRELNLALNAELLEEVKATGVQVNQADVAALRAATQSVYKEFEPTFGKELIDRVLEVVNSVN